ncbi:MAG: hypothetical protein WCR92_08920 [Candidatus Cloacimonadaceae bacterium]
MQVTVTIHLDAEDEANARRAIDLLNKDMPTTLEVAESRAISDGLKRSAYCQLLVAFEDAITPQEVPHGSH